MSKIQKIAVITSVIIVAALGILLGMFLWQESRHAKQVTQNSSGQQRQDVTQEEGTGKNEGESRTEKDIPSKLPENEEEPGTSEDARQKEDVQQKKEDMEQEKQEFTMVFTGDIFFSQYVLNNYDSGGIGEVLSESLQTVLREADIAMANEEFPFSTGGSPEEDKQFTFRVDPAYTAMLKDMGLDLVTLANNHALDFGTEALLDTFGALKGATIPYVGAGETKEEAARPVYLEAGGRKIGFLAASRVIPDVSWNIDNRQPGLFCTYDSVALDGAIAAAKSECDYVVVYVHWGIEREDTPQEYQRTLAKGYIDAGADLVVGAHPHVLQGIEYYQGKPIVYSLGNFIFNQEIPKTMALKVIVNENGETSLFVVPAVASGAFTQEMGPEEASELYSYLEDISFSVEVDEYGRVLPKQ